MKQNKNVDDAIEMEVYSIARQMFIAAYGAHPMEYVAERLVADCLRSAAIFVEVAEFNPE